MALRASHRRSEGREREELQLGWGAVRVGALSGALCAMLQHPENRLGALAPALQVWSEAAACSRGLSLRLTRAQVPLWKVTSGSSQEGK